MFRISKSSVIYQENYLRTLPPDDEAPEESAPAQQQESRQDDERRRLMSLQKTVSDKANAEAEKIKEAAREQAEQIIAEAKASAGVIIAKATEEVDQQKLLGWQEGHKDGKQSAQAEAENLKAAQMADFESAMERFERAFEEMTASMEKEILALVVDVARKVVHMEMDIDDEIYLAMVRHALSKLKGEKKVTVRVSPSEYGRFFSSGMAEFNINHRTMKVLVVEDHSMQKGDLIVESDSESIDAGVDVQLDTVEAAFERALITDEQD